jgi:L-amino acid N-acyltransferase YncA
MMSRSTSFGTLVVATGDTGSARSVNSAPKPPSRLQAGARLLRREGVVGVARSVAQRIQQRIWVTETHIWYEVTPDGASQNWYLSADTRLISGGESHLSALAALPTPVSEREAMRRLADGVELWLVMRDDEALFACWTFRDHAPVLAAPGGTLELPAGVVVVEDVVTADQHRGGGIAPAALATIARRMNRSVTQRLLAKVERSNGASRRAFRKAGFRPVARMHRAERGPFTMVNVESAQGGNFARLLSDRLDRSTGTDEVDA